jgi:hypothetical protein
MNRTLASCVSAVAFALVMFAPSKASAGGGYYGYDYGYGCGCVSYCNGWVRGRGFNRCPFRKSHPDVLMVQSSQDGNGDNGARSLDSSMQGRIFP